jgi:pyruvate/2-oxoglutarate dehydrogenase complex dihydrolipoamide acyltransferase (E2) component
MATARPLHRYAGTFAVSALGAQGAAILDSVSVLPAFLSYGPIAKDGAVDVHLAFDHRVMDGADGARALRALEVAIEVEVAPELRQLAG